jgi:hypothetical protein
MFVPSVTTTDNIVDVKNETNTEIVTVPNIDLIPDPEKIADAIVQPIIVEEVTVCNVAVY